MIGTMYYVLCGGIDMKRLLFLAVILSIVLVSGCSGNQYVVQNAGGVIQDFSFDFGSVYDDDTVMLTVEVQNVGGKKIDSTELYIYGQNMGGDTNVWQVKHASLGVGQSSPYIHDTLPSADFMPPDAEQGIPGEGRMYTFVLQPPDMLDGIPPVRQDFYARLCFPYSTSTLTQVELTSKNEMRAKRITSTKADTINAAGPIQLELKTQKNVRSKAGSELPLVFSVRDVGGGFATDMETSCSVDTDTMDRGRVYVVVTVDGQDADCGGGEVYLKKGEGTIYCKYAFGEADAPRTNFRVVATAYYYYYVERATSVQVQDSSID